jgi:hypothetical protein
MELSMGERKAVTKKMAAAYRRGTRPEKSVVLDQLVTLTGRHRDHARAELRQIGEIWMVTVRTPRTPGLHRSQGGSLPRGQAEIRCVASRLVAGRLRVGRDRR